MSTATTPRAGASAASLGERSHLVLGLVSTTPRRMAAWLGASILAAILMSIVVFAAFASVNGTATVVGKDSAPSIVAADHLQALAASADANALNALVTHNTDAYSSSQYRKDIRAAYEELTTASQYTTYGFAQIGPIEKMESELSQYDNVMGQLQVETVANPPSGNPSAGHTIIVKNILPARLALVNTDYSHLNQQYAGYQNGIGPLMALVWIAFLLLVGVLVGTQVYLFRHMHRIINPGYAIATIITLGCMIYSLGVFNVAESQLAQAKQHSFASINTLWTVRATAFLMNADESLYLLDAQNPQDLKTLTDEFTHYQQQISGYLSQELSHTTYPGEGAAVRAAIQTFASYVAIDGKVRTDLANGDIRDAQGLVLGYNPGQAALAFTQFDSAMWNAIDINQFQFDQQMNSVLGSLGPVPYVLGITLILIVVASIFGMKGRLDEYAI